MEERRRVPRKDTLVSVYSRVVNSRRPLRAVLRQAYPWVQEHEAAIASTFSIYRDRKRAQHLLDFDDLLLYWRAAVVDPDVGPVLAAAYDHVLVDEYQDTNLLQAEIVRALRAGGRPVTAVGDDAQAIYGFRAATVANMLEFPADFPGTAVVTLERNYRSTQPILDLANAVLADATEGTRSGSAVDGSGGAGGRRPVLATCPDEAAQADAVADVILEHHEAGVALRHQAVLFRSAHHSDLLEVELRRRGIPYVKYGGLRFLEAAHVRDLLAALRVLDNPYDELAWSRLLQLLDGVGPAGATGPGRVGVLGGAAAWAARAAGRLGVAGVGGDPLARFVEGPASSGWPCRPAPATIILAGRRPRRLPRPTPWPRGAGRPASGGARSAAAPPIRQRRGPPAGPRGLWPGWPRASRPGARWSPS